MNFISKELAVVMDIKRAFDKKVKAALSGVKSFLSGRLICLLGGSWYRKKKLQKYTHIH